MTDFKSYNEPHLMKSEQDTSEMELVGKCNVVITDLVLSRKLHGKPVKELTG